jgi:hypothetical protein
MASSTQQGHHDPVVRIYRTREGFNVGRRLSDTCVFPFAKLTENDAMIIVTRSRIG